MKRLKDCDDVTKMEVETYTSVLKPFLEALFSRLRFSCRIPTLSDDPLHQPILQLWIVLLVNLTLHLTTQTIGWTFICHFAWENIYTKKVILKGTYFTKCTFTCCLNKCVLVVCTRPPYNNKNTPFPFFNPQKSEALSQNKPFAVFVLPCSSYVFLLELQ